MHSSSEWKKRRKKVTQSAVTRERRLNWLAHLVRKENALVIKKDAACHAWNAMNQDV
jgi:hypothetical protein